MEKVREDVMNHIQDRFTWPETDTLIRFFLYTMGQEQRHELMGKYPVIYAKLHPGVASGAIQAAVNAELAKVG